MNKPTQPPPNVATEIVPFAMTIKGKMTVPAGTHPDLIKASVMSQVNVSASMCHLVSEIDIKTEPAGLAIAKG